MLFSAALLKFVAGSSTSTKYIFFFATWQNGCGFLKFTLLVQVSFLLSLANFATGYPTPMKLLPPQLSLWTVTQHPLVCIVGGVAGGRSWHGLQRRHHPALYAASFVHVRGTYT